MDQEALSDLRSIIDGLPAEERMFIASLAEDEVILLHHGVGASVRNRIRAGRHRALFAWSRTQIRDMTKQHFEELTWPIVLEIWRTVKSSAP